MARYEQVSRVLNTLASLCMIVASSAITWVTLSLPSPAPPPASVANAAPRPEAVRQVNLHSSLEDVASTTQGAASARLVVMEASDFERPFCGRYARDTYAKLRREFVDTGRVRYAFLNYPIATLHPLAVGAAIAAECAARQGKFWEMRERLFASPHALAPAQMPTHVEALGLSDEAFRACAADESSAAIISRHERLATELGVRSTPTVFIGEALEGRKVRFFRRIDGAQPFEVFRALIEESLAKFGR